MKHTDYFHICIVSYLLPQPTRLVYKYTHVKRNREDKLFTNTQICEKKRQSGRKKFKKSQISYKVFLLALANKKVIVPKKK